MTKLLTLPVPTFRGSRRSNYVFTAYRVRPKEIGHVLVHNVKCTHDLLCLPWKYVNEWH